MKKPVGKKPGRKRKKSLSLDALSEALENEKAMKVPAPPRKKRRRAPKMKQGKWGTQEPAAKPNYKGNRMGEGY